jgi:hypothetical protein
LSDPLYPTYATLLWACSSSWGAWVAAHPDEILAIRVDKSIYFGKSLGGVSVLGDDVENVACLRWAKGFAGRLEG